MLMIRFVKQLVLSCFVLMLCSCGGNSTESNSAIIVDDSSSGNQGNGQQDNGGSGQNVQKFIPIQTFTLDSDGPNLGKTAYQLIWQVFGVGSIESPDLYSKDHTEVEHIVEATDDVVGHYFDFLAHRDLDYNKGVISDRQRNEIKAYDNSNPNLLGYEGETFQYSWKFKVSSELELSSKFSHFFQLKAKNAVNSFANGDDDQPIVTISGVEKSASGNELQVRYSKGTETLGVMTSDVYLAKLNWGSITDEWLQIFVQATYAENGHLVLEITRLRDNNKILSIEESGIDLLRANDSNDFVRPKWGIYRSISETESLRIDVEKVSFANFVVTKGVLQE